MENFQVLFDDAEPAALAHPAYEPYGALGFPAPPEDRPWIYTNFVQTLDGIASLLGRHASGGDIAQRAEDRWLMDLLRAHADGVLLGLRTLIDEKALRGTARGPVFAVADKTCQDLRQKLGRGRERNIFVTGAAEVNLDEYKVFDGDRVEPIIVTTAESADRLKQQRAHPALRIIVAGSGKLVDLPQAMRLLRSELGVRYLLCEGGPTLNGNLARADLVDERFVTIAPFEAGLVVPPEQEKLPSERPTPTRPTTLAGTGFTKEKMSRWTWLSARRIRDHQFHRYRRMR